MRLSLRRLILLTLLTLTLGGAAAIGIISYRASRHALEREAVRLTGLVAENRRMSILRTLTRQRGRLQRMIDVATARCGIAVDQDHPEACFRRSAESFATFEGAAAARLLRPGEPPILVGGWHYDDRVPSGRLIAIHRDEGGKAAYVMAAGSNHVTLAIELPIAAIQHILADRTGLGEHGETFLVDSEGRPLSPVLDPEMAARTALGQSRDECLSGSAGESLGPNYRGVQVVRGFRPMPEIGGGCVLAEIGQTEAFAASASLGRQLVVATALIAIAGIVLSVFIADRIGAPIKRLQASARRLQATDFASVLEPSGPAEIRDLTEAFQAMTRSLRQSHESLAAANRVKDEFLATLSHELRTPLNAIMGWTALLRTTRPDEARIARGLEVIDRNAKAQAELVSDLLDMSRVIRGTLRLQPATIDLADVVRTAIDTVRLAADAKGIVLDARLSPCAMSGDAARLQQVVWNLLSNAVKFTPAGGTVTVSLVRRPADVEIAVRDTGPGIRPDFLAHIFEPFRQADAGPSRAQGGLGLGLAIARRLVELHGGSIFAGNAADAPGATFVVQLPLMAAELEPPAEPPIVKRIALDGVRVLVVEDHADTRELVAAALEEQGATVEEAASCAAALDAFRATLPDVVVADIGLPEEDGYALMRRIRALEESEGGQVPALALTAYARAEDRAQALACGFSAHLAKPVDTAELVAAVAALAHLPARM